MTKNLKAIIVDSPENLEKILSLRKEVFVKEQSVPIKHELDNLDTIEAIVTGRVTHVGIIYCDIALGAGRLVPPSNSKEYHHIGRIAVKKDNRRHGAGTILMNILHKIARDDGAQGITLSAQVYVREFYRNLGYKERGEIYDEVNIPHQDMDLTF